MKRTLSHVTNDGRVRMVDVSAKPLSVREASATGTIRIKRSTAEAVARQGVAKGNVLATAQIAGIQAAKHTAELIPLCHPLPLSHVAVELELQTDAVVAKCTARTTAATGVEMEALAGVTVALLTIYDMCKAVDDAMIIGEVRLLRKTKHPVRHEVQPALSSLRKPHVGKRAARGR